MGYIKSTMYWSSEWVWKKNPIQAIIQERSGQMQGLRMAENIAKLHMRSKDMGPTYFFVEKKWRC